MTREHAQQEREAFNAYCEGKPIQERMLDGKWVDVVSGANWTEQWEHRIKPEPKRVPLTESDLPPMFWVKTDISGITWFLATSVHPDNIRVGSADCSFNFLMEARYVWSTDRKTEHPFWKEVEG